MATDRLPPGQPPTPNHVWDPSGYWRLGSAPQQTQQAGQAQASMPRPPPQGGWGAYGLNLAGGQQNAYGGQASGGPGSGSMSVYGADPSLYAAYGQSSASGNSSSTQTNPYEDSAMKHFQSVLDGTKLPYDQGTKDAMLTQASDMSGAAEAANNQMAQQQAIAGGASATDPSLQGVAREYMAQRQGQNAAAANSINQRANVANFGAQQDAAGTMANYRLAQDERQYRAQRDLRAGGSDNTRGGTGQNPSGVRVQGYGGVDMNDTYDQDRANRQSRADYNSDLVNAHNQYARQGAMENAAWAGYNSTRNKKP